MKYLILLALVVFSFNAEAQLGKLAPDSLSMIAGKYVHDTVRVMVIKYSEDGNLKAVSGYVIRRTFVTKMGGNLAPETLGVYTDKWAAIKPEEVYDIKQKN